MSYGSPNGWPYYSRHRPSYMYLSANASNVTIKSRNSSSSTSPSSTKSADSTDPNKKGEKQARGSALVAKNPRSTNEVICSVERMAVSALDTPKLKDTCYNCFFSSEEVALKGTSPRRNRNSSDNETADVDVSVKPKLKVCTGCRVVKFCDKSCQSVAWESHHKFECPIYAALQPRILPNNVRAILRLLLQKEHNRLPPSLWEDVLKLKSHITELRRSGGIRWENLVIMAQGTKEYSKTDQDFAVLVELFCILMINSFTLTTSWCDPIGLCLHPLLARMNHSCEPNAYIHFPLEKFEDIIVVPLRKITKNEEITISYVDTTESVEKRQEQLLERYFFVCECSKCSKEKIGIGLHQFNSASLTSVEAKTIQLLDGAVANTSITQQIEKLRYALFILEDSKAWPVARDPYPRLLHKLILAYIDDHQYNIALAYASIQHFDIDPEIFATDFHPVRITHTMLLVRLMNLIIDTENWTLQNLDLRPFGLNLVWLRRYLLRNMQRALDKTCVSGMPAVVSAELIVADRAAGVSPGFVGSIDANIENPANYQKAMQGVRKLTDWAYNRIRRWEVD